MPRRCLQFEDRAWRGIFWVSLPPGLLFVLGGFFVTESPRWLFRRGHKERARAALLRSRNAEQAALELEEMAATAHAASVTRGKGSRFAAAAQIRDSLPAGLRDSGLQQATGINSIIQYNTGILLRAD